MSEPARRAMPALRTPSPTRELASFPSSDLDTVRAPLYRAHHVARDAWYFDTTLGPSGGRFNLPSPDGTCYAATDVETALRESLGATIGNENVLERDIAATRRISRISVTYPIHVAELAARSAVAYGANRELSVGGDYPTTQTWAVAFASAHFDGVRYESRFTTAAEPTAVAIFGPRAKAELCTDRADMIDGERACELCGIALLPSTLDDLTAEVISPPGVDRPPG